MISSDDRPPGAPFAKPLTGKVPLGLRIWTMAALAWRMIVHNRAKSAGTIFGIMFGLRLTNQQVAILDSLLARNCEYIDNAVSGRSPAS